MKRSATVLATAALVCCLGVVGATACSGSQNGSNSSSDASITHQAPTVNAAHKTRMEKLSELGPYTCYGCHGSNDKANPMLAGITAMPDNHYLNEDPSTHTLDPSRSLCNTCHVPAY